VIGNPFLTYVDALRRQKAKAVTFLQPGNPSAGAAIAAEFPDLAVPEDVIALWRAFNGVAPTGETPFYFFAEAEAIEDYRGALTLQDQEEFRDYWPAGFFPVGSPGDGSRLLVNCIPGSPTHGSVYELIHGDGLYRRADTLSRYFETALVWLERGATRVTCNGQVEPDFARAKTIARELNPGCDGWDDTLPPAHEIKDWRH
jgi:hypothetical protein